MISHPLYIAPDEEIISVIARLRALEESEVVLVFPKTSVVTQSIINLKLLAREGEKLQKNITLVSQNENARNLAEKLGFSTLPYTSEIEKAGHVYIDQDGVSDEVNTETTSAVTPPIETPVPEQSESNDSYKPHSTEIGSSSFTVEKPIVAGESAVMGDIKTPLKTDIPPVGTTSIRVRNNSPERPPSLNSVRYEERKQESGVEEESVLPKPEAVVAAPLSYPTEKSTSSVTSLQNFFNRPTSSVSQAPVKTKEELSFVKKETILPSKTKPTPAPVLVHPATSKKLRFALGMVTLFVFLSVGALAFFLVFPKATVTIVVQKLEETADKTFSVPLSESAQTEIRLSKTTREITVETPGIATGAASGVSSPSSGSRAKGKIKVTNNYSAEEQPLVATTRFESADGKIYRTPVAVTIPGNGSVEIEVVADGTGGSYNTENSTFTIPGFKGSPKYEKITATVSTAISGGDGNEEKFTGGTFIRADEEVLRQRAEATAKQMFADEINNDEGEEYTFADGLIAERIAEQNLPKVGTTPGEYTYNTVFRVTAYTVSKSDVTKILTNSIKTEYDGIQFVPTEQKIEFTDFTIDEKGENASLKAHLTTTLKATLNEDTVKKDLAGKAADEMETFTKAHPEVQSLEAVFNPSWALKRIPSSTKNIELQIH